MPTSVGLHAGEQADRGGCFAAVYSPLIRGWCRDAGLQDADAADVAQEVLRAVDGGLDGFRQAGPASFRRWLHRVTQNKAADLLRRRPVGGTGDGGSDAQAALAGLADDDTGVEQTVARDEQRALVRRAMKAVLSDFGRDAREAFLATVVDRRPAAAVAAELGMTPNAVYLAAARVKRRLREEFSGLIEL